MRADYVPPEPVPCVVVDEHRSGAISRVYGPFPDYAAAATWAMREMPADRLDDSAWRLAVRELHDPAAGAS